MHKIINRNEPTGIEEFHTVLAGLEDEISRLTASGSNRVKLDACLAAKEALERLIHRWSKLH
ncbi:hypothetical protein G3A39_39540 [Paraburkholderia aspalathi]|nr:hypothetical protein [Paraburkholderia aspalathi]